MKWNPGQLCRRSLEEEDRNPEAMSLSKLMEQTIFHVSEHTER